MDLRQIDIQECHQELLKIAQIFDKICNKYNIPYYMMGGTMLGAIRHKGFIPWDDDMDFGIPRPFFKQFLNIIQKELPKQLSLITNKDKRSVKKGFVKIQLNGSKIIEKVFDSQKMDFYNGIAIDIFPLDGANTTNFIGKCHQHIAFLLIRIYEGRFCSLDIRKGVKRMLALIIKCLPINDENLIKYIDKWIQKFHFDKSTEISNYYGHWKEKETMDKNIFGKPIYYTFENIQLKGVYNSDLYLKSLYDDYMKLPPLKYQITHADKIYKEI